MKHNTGPLPHNITYNPRQYHKINFNGILFTTNTRDNCCILYDGSIYIVTNIFMANIIWWKTNFYRYMTLAILFFYLQR